MKQSKQPSKPLRRPSTLLGIGLCAVIALTGCGGGGGDSSSSTNASPEGVYGGKLTGSSSTDFQMLVLENNDVWTMYGIQGTSTFSIKGFAQGSGVASNGTYTSSNSKDFGYSPAIAAATSATYDTTAKTIAGTFTATGATISFSGTPLPSSTYDYTKAATLSTVAGSWTLTSLTNETLSVTVASDGTFTASGGGGCTFSGSVTPRASGKNVFNLSMTFGAAPCALPNQTATGIALAYPLSSGKTQLLLAATDSTRTYGTGAVGSR